LDDGGAYAALVGPAGRGEAEQLGDTTAFVEALQRRAQSALAAADLLLVVQILKQAFHCCFQAFAMVAGHEPDRLQVIGKQRFAVDRPVGQRGFELALVKQSILQALRREDHVAFLLAEALAGKGDGLGIIRFRQSPLRFRK
jgi:hypothetical protein